MKFMVVIPHYGTDSHLFCLLPSLGVGIPDEKSLSAHSITTPWKYGDICIVNNNIQNIGFTAASNMGIYSALQGNYDAVWLLNNDTEVPNIDTAVSLFEKELRENRFTGVIGCKMISMADRDLIHHGGTKSLYPSGIHKSGKISAGDFNERTKEKWVTGASMVISRACLQKTGALDDRFFNYASDSDFCYRARASGFDVIYLPVPIYHAIGESANPSPAQLEILRKDMQYFEAKWLTGEFFRYLDNQL